MTTPPRSLKHSWIILSFLALTLNTFSVQSARSPNIILFFADDLGWTDVGFMGSTYYETPHLDQLAKDGVKFSSAYSNGPNCAPTRASLLSGLYPPRHGIYTVGDPERGNHRHRKLIPTPNRTLLEHRFITFAEVLQSNGYRTAAMGKWHLGPDPRTQGFDVNIAGREWGSPSGGGYHSPYQYPNLVQEEKGEYLTDRLGEEACQFIKTNQDRPFYLYLSHYAVHTPIQARKDLKEKYDKKEPSGGHQNAAYAAMIESLDASLGKVRQTLKDTGLSDNTIILFTSDNGGVGKITSNHPLRGSKGMLYEGGIRVPMAIYWPGITPKNTTINEPVISFDLYPTILEMAGLPLPMNYPLDGESLVPLIKNPCTKLSRNALFWHFPAYLQGNGEITGSPFRTTPASAIRQGDWKLIEYFEDNRVELYHLSKDIGETQDQSHLFPEKTKALHTALVQWREKVNAPIPHEPNPLYRP